MMGIGESIGECDSCTHESMKKNYYFPFFDKTVARLAINKKHRQAYEQYPCGDMRDDNRSPGRNHIQKNRFEVT